MIEAIKAGYDSIKGALDIAQGFQALKTEAAVNQAVIDIQRGLLEAQRALTEADNRHTADLKLVGELEQEIMRLKDWTAERERYELINMRGGSVAYAEKADVENRQKPHWLCANCFDHGTKSYLLKQGENGPNVIHKCGACNVQMSVDRNTVPL